MKLPIYMQYMSSQKSAYTVFPMTLLMLTATSSLARLTANRTRVSQSLTLALPGVTVVVNWLAGRVSWSYSRWDPRSPTWRGRVLLWAWRGLPRTPPGAWNLLSDGDWGDDPEPVPVPVPIKLYIT